MSEFKFTVQRLLYRFKWSPIFTIKSGSLAEQSTYHHCSLHIAQRSSKNMQHSKRSHAIEKHHMRPRDHHAPRRNRQAITRNFYFAIFRKIILIFQRKSLSENNLLNSYLRNSLFNVITSKNELIKQEIYWARNSSVTLHTRHNWTTDLQCPLAYLYAVNSKSMHLNRISYHLFCLFD